MENVFIIQVIEFISLIKNVFNNILINFILDDPEPYISGTRINSPHYLSKIVLNDKTPSKFTLVVSQYEKMNTIHYTLRAYATCPFIMKELSNSYKTQFKTVIFF